MGFMRNEKGDAAAPLLRAAMDHVERNFPSLILDALKDHKM